jgi:hypothetical protein
MDEECLLLMKSLQELLNKMVFRNGKNESRKKQD